VNDPEFTIRITDGEIGDRSKGDALAKGILAMQASWFIYQCIGRWAQGLSLALLELSTLALASLNGITFLLWWEKPLGVEVPVRVYMNRNLTDAERATEGRSHSARDTLSFSRVVPWAVPVGLLETLVYIMLSPLIASTILSFLFFATSATINDVVTCTSFPADATHVPTFYVPRHGYSKYWHISLLLVLGTIFGGIHCAGWNLSFPTDGEQRLWHVNSIAITIFPIAAIPSFAIYFCLNTMNTFIFLLTIELVVNLIYIVIFVISSIFIIPIFRLLGCSHLIHLLHLMEDKLGSITAIVTATVPTPKLPTISDLREFVFFMIDRDETPLAWVMMVYLTVRLSLLILALAQLRHLPPSAFIAIDWTKFYPHVVL
jgi:hypothetical protein